MNSWSLVNNPKNCIHILLEEEYANLQVANYIPCLIHKAKSFLSIDLTIMEYQSTIFYLILSVDMYPIVIEFLEGTNNHRDSVISFVSYLYDFYLWMPCRFILLLTIVVTIYCC